MRERSRREEVSSMPERRLVGESERKGEVLSGQSGETKREGVITEAILNSKTESLI